MHPRIDEDLFTLEKYADFEMEFDWKISRGGNSGVKYRIQDRVMLAPRTICQGFEDLVNLPLKNRIMDRPARRQECVVGFEYQALDNARHPDGKRGPIHQSRALYDIYPQSRDATKPIGE